MTGQVPSIIAHAAVTTATGSVNITGHAPSASAGAGLQLFPSNAVLTLTGQAPTAVAFSAVAPTTGGSIDRRQTPTFSAHHTACASDRYPGHSWSGADRRSGIDRAAHNGRPGDHGLGADGQRFGQCFGNADHRIANITGFAPTVTVAANFTATPTTAALSLNGIAPSVVASAARAPTTGTLVLTGQAPAIMRTALVVPTTGALSITGFAPAVSAGAGLQLFPANAALTLAGQAPAVSASATTAPAPDAVVITGFASTVSVGTDVTAQPTTAALTITGRVPSVSSSHLLTVAPDVVVIAGQAPTVIAGQDISVTPQTGSLAIIGQTATFAGHFTAVPDPDALIVTGWPPALEGEQVMAPATWRAHHHGLAAVYLLPESVRRAGLPSRASGSCDRDWPAWSLQRRSTKHCDGRATPRHLSCRTA